MNTLLKYFIFTYTLLIAINHTTHCQQLIQTTQLQKLTATEINSLLTILGDTTQVTYGVSTYKVLYYTPHLDGQPDTASGLLVIPEIVDESLPVLFYQHGTANDRYAVPSSGSAEGLVVTAAGGMGYVSFAPDYLGLGDSKGFHPYLHAATEASCAYDLLNATLPFLEQLDIQLNGQIFITGYSQGGHAAMALHEYLESTALPDEFYVVASSPMSGPYSISGEMVSRLTSNITYLYPGYAIYILLSYNQAYNLFEDLSQILHPPYIPIVEQFYQEQISISELHVQLSNTLLKETGSIIVKDMFLDSIILGLENPENSILQSLQENDTYAWGPQAPTRLIYCMKDDQVVYTNAIFADSVMNSLGAFDLTSVDVLSNANHTSCFLPALKYTLAFFDQLRFTTNTQIENLLNIQAYPNPASNRITITGLPTSGRADLLNELGQKVLTQQITKGRSEIELPSLIAGIYLLRINAISGTRTIRLVIL